MILDINYQQRNYGRDILPFIRNGILFDTSVIKILIDGLIEARYGKRENEEFKALSSFLDYVKVNNNWKHFVITPHVLTEVCTHLRNDYAKHSHYCEIVTDVMPILKDMAEEPIDKQRILAAVDSKKPVIEVGDISIFLVTDDFANDSKKISILVKDDRFNRRYDSNPNVMIMDFNKIMLNC